MDENTANIILQNIADDVKEIKENSKDQQVRISELEKFVARQSVINGILTVIGSTSLASIVGIALKLIFGGN